jgi:hypothetical protein
MMKIFSRGAAVDGQVGQFDLFQARMDWEHNAHGASKWLSIAWALRRLIDNVSINDQLHWHS